MPAKKQVEHPHGRALLPFVPSAATFVNLAVQLWRLCPRGCIIGPRGFCEGGLDVSMGVLQALEAFWEDPEAFAPPWPESDAAAIEAMYEKYREEDENAIGVDGTPVIDLPLLMVCVSCSRRKGA